MYLDSSAWGLVVQVIVGSLVAIPVLAGIYWRSIKARFFRGKDAKGK